MNNDLKPDLGYYLQEAFGTNVDHTFKAVLLFQIAHVGHNLYSSTSNTKFDGKEYAATFDFTIIQLEDMLNQIDDIKFSSYINSKLNKEFKAPHSVDFYDNPIMVDIKAQLGNPVESMYETFIPFIVREFGNIKLNTY